MSNHLRFRIPTLDSLFGFPDANVVENERPMSVGRLSFAGGADGGEEYENCGVPFLEETPANKEPTRKHYSVSLCIAGPDGTGKSILAMHLASAYRADTLPIMSDAKSAPKIIYVSTDIGHVKASNAWRSFGLGIAAKSLPCPFFPQVLADNQKNRITPARYLPIEQNLEGSDARGDNHDGRPLVDYLLSQSAEEVAFLDLKTATAGDDWAYITNAVASLPQPEPGMPPHLLIIDAVEGLLTSGGYIDIHGLVRERRARTAQLVRTAKNKCHLVFICESKEEAMLPEEYISDAVLRIRTRNDGAYSGRTIEVVKNRGRRHVRGEHPFSIRNGSGTTTDDKEHPDDPSSEFSYFIVHQSLHSRYRDVMGVPDALARSRPDKDNMGLRSLLDGTLNVRPGTITALVGPDGTFKSRIARSFLAGCFLDALESPKIGDKWDSNGPIRRCPNPGVLITTDYLADPTIFERLADHLEAFGDDTLLESFEDPRRKKRLVSNNPYLSAIRSWEGFVYRRLGVHQTTPELLFSMIERAIDKARRELQSELERSCCWNVIEAQAIDIRDNVLTGEGVRRWSDDFQLHYADKIDERIYGKENLLKKMRTIPGWQDAHEPQFRQIFSAFVKSEMSRVRVVIDDWASIARMFPQVANDTLFLPFLTFYLRVENVTALIVETVPSRNEFDQSFSISSEVAVHAQQKIYTKLSEQDGLRQVTARVDMASKRGQTPTGAFEVGPLGKVGQYSDSDAIEVRK